MKLVLTRTQIFRAQVRIAIRRIECPQDIRRRILRSTVDGVDAGGISCYHADSHTAHSSVKRNDWTRFTQTNKFVFNHKRGAQKCGKTLKFCKNYGKSKSTV